MTTPTAESNDSLYVAHNGRIKQSVVQWCFKKMPIDELARHAARMGILSVEVVGPEHWPMLKKLNLTCALSVGHSFDKGFAHKEEYSECIDKLRSIIDITADAGFPNVITFSGFRRGIDEAEGRNNMVEGLKQIVGHAEKRNVTLCLEMLNSRVDIEMKGHPDYFCDTIESAVEVCERVGSERLKVLFDIYHVQIMQGDIITRIKKFHSYIGHYHTAGNPGREEIDDTQEINYAPILRAIVETKYQGYVGQEFIPRRDAMASLNEAVRICDV
ncbi:MAG: TIM barrel protein [Planctomycetales bacterium]|nr:TIM barrel protein [Planctomycetales bacterium]